MGNAHPLFERRRIFAPGPTPVPETVLADLAQAPLHHRTKEFIAQLDRVKEGLQFVFQTRQPAYVLASSGTGAMECALVNLFAQGDEVLVVDGGKFGERWGKLAARFGLKVHRIEVPWGRSVDPEAVRRELKAKPQIRGVLFQACETSTGVYHPTEAIAKVVHECGNALTVVDAITALGVQNLPMDEWGLDVVLSGSQKAFMLPPGLAFLALSAKAHEARKRANVPRFYFSLDAEDKAAKGGETAWTPAVSLVSGLDVVLQRFKKVGLEPVFRHHRRLGEATRRGVQAMGLELFAKDQPSDALTAVLVPSTVPDGKKVVSYLRDRFDITIAGGQDAYAGKIFRLAHLGYFDALDVLTILSATEMTLAKLGHRADPGAGAAAAQRYFLETES